MERILIVDDEPNIIQGIQRSLHSEPYTLLSATSAFDALNILKQQSMDVIISDEMMPRMRGSELLNICLQNYPQMIRIMLTGNRTLDAAMGAIYDGAVFYFLEKPVDSKHLKSVIHSALLLRSLEIEAEEKNLVMDIEQQRELLSRYGVELTTVSCPSPFEPTLT